jgi:hypothetical protein
MVVEGELVVLVVLLPEEVAVVSVEIPEMLVPVDLLGLGVPAQLAAAKEVIHL